MKSFLSNEELQLQFQTADFILKTQMQIAKDFHSSGVAFNTAFETIEMNYSEILKEVIKKLESILARGETQFMQLLYQIDIPQNNFLSLTTDLDFISKMGDLIIRREAYKVYLRSQF